MTKWPETQAREWQKFIVYFGDDKFQTKQFFCVIQSATVQRDILRPSMMKIFLYCFMRYCVWCEYLRDKRQHYANITMNESWMRTDATWKYAKIWKFHHFDVIWRLIWIFRTTRMTYVKKSWHSRRTLAILTPLHTFYPLTKLWLSIYYWVESKHFSSHKLLNC